ncbi:lipopolysaccharide kinase InaA family protein, partial [Pseudomaricurvus sp.]|uniref:lipopolysaccharide kinase InaA family protein n=1 Tax=Pseudomaricurvus sp. TaxID=2004510 RepID=UPI003F6C45C2
DILPQWPTLTETVREQVLRMVGKTVANMHGERITHHCLYPKHIFVELKEESEVDMPRLTLIDLEKSRFQLLRKRERAADLDALFRRTDSWSHQERELVLATYVETLSEAYTLTDYQKLLQKRTRKKLNGKRTSRVS